MPPHSCIPFATCIPSRLQPEERHHGLPVVLDFVPAAETLRLLAMAQAAAVTIHLPTALRKYCSGAADLSVSAPTVRAALEELHRDHPSLYRNICDETGSVRRHLNVFVNSSHVRERDGLDTALAAGDVVTILAAVSGG